MFWLQPYYPIDKMRNPMFKNVFVAVTALLILNTSGHAAEHPIRLVTTTSTNNSGLLQKPLPPLEEKSAYQVHVIAVGTGKALRMGRAGDGVVLGHFART